MLKFFKECLVYSATIISALFTLVPEAVFETYTLSDKISDEMNIILLRVLCCIVVFVISGVFNLIYKVIRNEIKIKGKNYNIEIKYGDLFEEKECKKIIPFDECFTTKVGTNPEDINPDSICGQYLRMHPIQDMQALINSANLKPSKKKSKYQGKECYTSGKIIQNGEYLLLAFAKLNENGLGELTRKEYIECLSVLWEEIDKYYGQKDVCMPILGSGVTRIDGVSITQQELLDIIIYSYKMSRNKIKTPSKLKIICKKKDDFSLNKIGESL